MILIYVTLNNNEEAEKIGEILIDKNLTNCVNYFPITCIYSYQGKTTKEPEVVLIIKTLEDKFGEIEKVIKTMINYDNFIGQIKVEKINEPFLNWLNKTVNDLH